MVFVDRTSAAVRIVKINTDSRSVICLDNNNIVKQNTLCRLRIFRVVRPFNDPCRFSAAATFSHSTYALTVFIPTYRTRERGRRFSYTKYRVFFVLFFSYFFFYVCVRIIVRLECSDGFNTNIVQLDNVIARVDGKEIISAALAFVKSRLPQKHIVPKLDVIYNI